MHLVGRLSSRGCATAAKPAAAASSDAASSNSPATAQAAAEGSTGAPADKKEDKKDEEEKTGWGMYLVYAMGWASGLTFLYYFYREDYSFHRTEIAIVNTCRSLPLYYPPGNTVADRNGNIDGEGLSPELVLAFEEWFVTLDLQQAEGVIRDDVLELFREMGFDESAKQCKRYLERGEGTLEERRRMSGTGLQESLSLLADLAFRATPAKVEEGVEPPVDPRTLVGPDAVKLLRKKLKGVASISAGAQALQNALQPQLDPLVMGAPQSMSPAPSRQEEAPAASIASLPAMNFSDDDDDEPADSPQQLQLEDARLRRQEDSLMALLNSRGSLSAAEEGRLRDVRDQRASLNRGA